MADMKYTFDQTDLDEAIELAVHGTSTTERSGDDGTDTPPGNQPGQRASSQEVIDGREELERFFSGDPTQEVPQYDEEDEEVIDEDPENKDSKDEGTEKTKPEEEETVSDEDEDFSLLDIIREEGLLYIPDEFDGELDADTLDYFKQQTRQIQEQQILNSIKSRFAGDPEKLAYFEYFMAAGPDADLPKYKGIVDQLKYYETHDVSKEETQKAILREWLKEGLDPKNPAHSLRLSRIEQDVKDIIDNYEGDKKAKEAKAYFVQKYREMAQEEELRVAEQQKRQEYYKQQEEQREMEWHRSFQNSLNQRGWSETKKQAILEEQYGEIMLQDGSYIPVWYAKEAMIKQDPELYQVYLDWLNTNFDLNSGKFIEKESDPNKIATRKILEMAKKKQGPSKSDQSLPSRGQRQYRDPVVDPLDNI